MINEFSRTQLILGKEGVDCLKDKKVMIFGVGGVGSHCIEALARCGVGHLVLVDNDTVAMTNINRQSIALHSTVGRYKTEVMKEKIMDICPEIEVITKNVFVLPENVDEVIPMDVDYIIDAIDTVAAKLAITIFAKKHDIPIIACMATGNKIHPELFEIEDISKTSVCPLCKVMRRELKQRGIYHLKVLYSKEKPLVTKEESTEDKGKRRVIPGSVSFTPPVAGLIIAGAAIRELLFIEE